MESPTNATRILVSGKSAVATLGSNFELLAEESVLPAGYTDAAYASAIALSPDGRHLFAGIRVHDSIARFDIDAGQVLGRNVARWAIAQDALGTSALTPR